VKEPNFSTSSASSVGIGRTSRRGVAIVVEYSLHFLTEKTSLHHWKHEEESPITKHEDFGERKCVTLQVLSNDENLQLRKY